MPSAGSQKSSTIVAVAIPHRFSWLPILEVAVGGDPAFLSANGYSAPIVSIFTTSCSVGVFPIDQAVLVLYGVSACFGLFSLLLLNPGGAAVAAVLVLVGIGVLMVSGITLSRVFGVGPRGHPHPESTSRNRQ